jgi:hypothetical protein
MRAFRVQKAGRNLIIHSHLPPLNSRAYGRFIDEHLVAGSEGPSHAQVGLTDRCPQNCAYCYNRGRKGEPMDTLTIPASSGSFGRSAYSGWDSRVESPY